MLFASLIVSALINAACGNLIVSGICTTVAILMLALPGVEDDNGDEDADEIV